MRRSAAHVSNRAGAGGRAAALLLTGALLLPAPLLAETPAEPETAPEAAAAPRASAEELKAAIDEIKRRLARQREAQGQAAPAATLADELKAAGQRLQGMTEAMELLRAERDQLREEFAAAREQLERLGQELLQGQRQAQAAAERIRTLEDAGREAQAAAAAAAARLEQTEAELARSTGRTGELEQALASLRDAAEQGAAGAAARDAQLAELQAALAARTEQLQAVSTELEGREGQSLDLAARIEGLELELAQARSNGTTKAAEAERLGADLARTRSEQAAIEKALRDAAAALGARERELQTASAEQAAMTSEIDAVRDHAGALAGELEALQAVAGTSVQEVQSLAEQLMETLAENQSLLTALAEVRVTREVLDRELRRARDDAAAAALEAAGLRTELLRAREGVLDAGAAPATPAAAGTDAAVAAPDGDAAAEPGAPMTLLQLEVSDREDPAAAAVPAAAPAAALGATEAERLRELKAVEREGGWLMIVPEGLDFRLGTSELTPAGEAALAKVGVLLAGYADGRARIVGHTDSEGAASDNERLSLQRAESVRRHLVARHGLDAERITTEGYGESQPVMSNRTPEGRRANRRVEIFIRR